MTTLLAREEARIKIMAMREGLERIGHQPMV